jgi:acyl carrier protein
MARGLIANESGVTLDSVEAAIRGFLMEEVLYDKQIPVLGSRDSLLESELLDSIAIMQIVTFCEQAFEIVIPEEELLPEHFENIQSIAQLVGRLAEKTRTC